MKRLIVIMLLFLLVSGTVFAATGDHNAPKKQSKQQKAAKQAAKDPPATSASLANSSDTVTANASAVSRKADPASQASPPPTNQSAKPQSQAINTSNAAIANSTTGSPSGDKTNSTQAGNTSITRSNTSTISSNSTIASSGISTGNQPRPASAPDNTNIYSQLVYVTLQEEVINLSDTVTVTLDAKNFVSGIGQAEAAFRSPSGKTILIKLTRISGDQHYGTWSGVIKASEYGRYNLTDISLYAAERQPTYWPVKGRSFYVLSPDTGKKESLKLVYSVIDKNRLRKAGNVTLRIDASDYEGITGAVAEINSTRGESFSVPLVLVSGDLNYGTWEAQISLNSPDTTYNIYSITLYDSKGSKAYPLTDRRIYLDAVPYRQPPRSSGQDGADLTAQEWASMQIKSPFFPTIVGFSIMILLILIAMIGRSAGPGAEKKI